MYIRRMSVLSDFMRGKGFQIIERVTDKSTDEKEYRMKWNCK